MFWSCSHILHSRNTLSALDSEPRTSGIKRNTSRQSLEEGAKSGRNEKSFTGKTSSQSTFLQLGDKGRPGPEAGTTVGLLFGCEAMFHLA